jgi:hypothetical protein
MVPSIRAQLLARKARMLDTSSGMPSMTANSRKHCELVQCKMPSLMWPACSRATDAIHNGNSPANHDGGAAWGQDFPGRTRDRGDA